MAERKSETKHRVSRPPSCPSFVSNVTATAFSGSSRPRLAASCRVALHLSCFPVSLQDHGILDQTIPLMYTLMSLVRYLFSGSSPHHRNSLCVLHSNAYRAEASILAAACYHSAALFCFLPVPSLVHQCVRFKLLITTGPVSQTKLIYDYIKLSAGAVRGDSLSSHRHAS